VSGGAPEGTPPLAVLPGQVSTLLSSSTGIFTITSSVATDLGGVQTFVPTTFTTTGVTLVPIATTTTPSAATSKSASTSRTVAMAGGIVGAAILLIGGILLCLFLRKRRRNQALYLSSRPDSPLRDAERSMPSNADVPVFSMVTPQPSAAPSVSIPSIVVASPEMTEDPFRRPSAPLTVHKKPVPTVSPQDLAALEAAPVTANKPTSYVLEVDAPTSSMASMAFDPTTFAQSLGKDPAWAAVLAPTASANPFEDPVNPFADPQPKTRLSEMPEIPKHLRMSTTSSTLSREGRPSSPTSTIYHEGFAM